MGGLAGLAEDALPLPTEVGRADGAWGNYVSVYEDDWRDDKIDKETEEEFIKVEEDFTNNSNIDGPKSSCRSASPFPTLPVSFVPSAAATATTTTSHFSLLG